MKAPFREFSRTPSWDESGLSCDCAGLISLLDQRFHAKEKAANLKAFEYFDRFQEQGALTNIHELKRFDVLAWRKENPPSSGDTGHILVLARAPKKISDSLYKVAIIEVNRFQGLCHRDIELVTKKDGTLIGVAWHPESSSGSGKVKHTTIIGHSFFKEVNCQSCLQPQRSCLCEYLPESVRDAPPFTVFRHHEESHHPLGTVQLLELYYKNLEVLDSDCFEERSGVLIYPETEDFEGPLVTKLTGEPLIFIDATWSKSFRLLQENPWLKKLPRYSLKGKNANYQVRKSPHREALSTLESFALCLKEHPQGIPEQAVELTLLFEKFIAGKKEFIGDEKLEKYYR